MNDNRYNGWVNYETWNAALWIDNDGRSEHWNERAPEILESCEFDKDAACVELAAELEAEADEFRPEVSGMYADLLGAAMGAIDWREIAEHYMDEIEVWSAGWNMPGCLPDAEAARFLDADSAREYIADEMAREADARGEELTVSEIVADAQIVALNDAAETIRDGSGEFGQTIGSYHYFVTKL